MQDRAFNGAMETRAFLGANELRSSSFSSSLEWPHGLLTLDFVVEQVPVQIQVGVLWCRSEWHRQGNRVVTCEFFEQRVLQEGARPEVHLLESVTDLERYVGVDDALVVGRNRIAEYQVQGENGVLAALAGDRAISLFDYSWELRKEEEGSTRMGQFESQFES